MEPLLIDYCVYCAAEGFPLNKSQIICLAEDLIKGREFYNKFVTFKKKCKHKNQSIREADRDILGNRWYYNMLQRNNHFVSRGRRKIRDVKRHNWCTYQNFENMYIHIYDKMVQFGIAKEMEDEFYFDKTGKLVSEDSCDKFGRKTRYVLTNPEKLIFVDECGSNTSMANNGNVAGELFITHNNGSCSGILSCMTDIHFTVMVFTAATRDPVLCAIVHKSNKNVTDLPLYLRYEIEVTK